jgi:hypothetical protein
MNKPLKRQSATVAKAPCKSCPYRRDVPSGVWDASEYDKLPLYDGELDEQLMKGGQALFNCHQQDGHLCAGWLATHGPDNLIALRLASSMFDVEIMPEVWAYQSPVPVFETGQQACDHGKAEIDNPGAKATRTVTRLLRKQTEL